MVRLTEIPEPMRSHIAALDCPAFDTKPLVAGPPLQQRRVALISTAGLHHRSDRPFMFMANDYRIIPGNITAHDLVMSHISTNFDRTGFQQDWNVVFPLDRLHALTKEGIIGSVAEFHYSFMGATDPKQMEQTARHLADLLKRDQVNAVLLVPV
ncbi:MAG: selenoprotein B glycine/betaine/sarcosine/D-proline reductase [Candidatus Tectomicrobia bacterium]|uniref:Selenoprotein B glycine/betaine/sarcosine/D-proline reductase n=1 Tax=Tectimicrobiota bacterium TaxID=2528274 RepID=A0A933GKP7_UNCTE|nr:selenoprotein B glycine/betaine/sarcosine/D-proline reductase [Candidatus Tectomicrobia bacterium]